MFTRTIENTIKEKFNSGKAIILVGARQVGKTTLLKKLLTNKKFLFLDADDHQPEVYFIILQHSKSGHFYENINMFFSMKHKEFQE